MRARNFLWEMGEFTTALLVVFALLAVGSLAFLYGGTRLQPRVGSDGPDSFVPCRQCGGEVRRGRSECPWCRAQLVRYPGRAQAPSGHRLELLDGGADGERAPFDFELLPPVERRRRAV